MLSLQVEFSDEMMVVLQFSVGARNVFWRRKWQPSPVFVSEKSHRQSSLVSCSPKGHRESNTTAQLNTQHRECVMVDFLQQNALSHPFSLHHKLICVSKACISLAFRRPGKQKLTNKPQYPLVHKICFFPQEKFPLEKNSEFLCCSHLCEQL